MLEHVSALIAQQKAELETWLTQAPDVGNLIAEEVLDALELELEELTCDGLVRDFSQSIKNSLLATLGAQVDEACEKWISTRIEALSNSMQASAGDAWHFVAARTSLDNLRKSMRVRKSIAPKFDAIFDEASPGFLDMISRAFNGSRDDGLSRMENDIRKDAVRLRKAFGVARHEISAEISQALADLLRRAAFSYLAALAGLSTQAESKDIPAIVEN